MTVLGAFGHYFVMLLMFTATAALGIAAGIFARKRKNDKKQENK